MKTKRYVVGRVIQAIPPDRITDYLIPKDISNFCIRNGYYIVNLKVRKKRYDTSLRHRLLGLDFSSHTRITVFSKDCPEGFQGRKLDADHCFIVTLSSLITPNDQLIAEKSFLCDWRREY